MDDIQQIRRDAITRVQARRRPAEYRVVPVGGGETSMQVDRGAGDFLPPKDAREFFDDRIARTPGHLGEWVRVLYQIARADGAAAAVAAVGTARALSPWDQWHLYVTLRSWQGGMTVEAAPILRAVLAEWETLGLVMAEPTDTPLPVAPEPKPPKVTYRSRYGQPAGMAF